MYMYKKEDEVLSKLQLTRKVFILFFYKPAMTGTFQMLFL